MAPAAHVDQRGTCLHPLYPEMSVVFSWNERRNGSSDSADAVGQSQHQAEADDAHAASADQPLDAPW